MAATVLVIIVTFCSAACAGGLRLPSDQITSQTPWSEKAHAQESLLWPETFMLGKPYKVVFTRTDVWNATQVNGDCLNPPVMWSRGFSRACCNIYVPCYEQYSVGEGAHDVQYQPKMKNRRPRRPRLPSYSDQFAHLAEPGVTVYVPSINMKEFVDTFDKLPSSASVTLVTGQEDIGVPRELWGEGRRSEQRPPTAMGYKDFIADPRLKHWFVQNYDLTGCSPLWPSSTCSPIAEDDPLAQKVTPIPIGLDLHTLAEKSGSQSVESQLRDLYELRAAGTRLHEKQDDKLLMPFLDFSRDRTNEHQLPAVKAVRWTGPRRNMWEKISKEYMFVCTPFGHGMDTHRLWETLILGSIPVVRTSSLDRLYQQFPIIIVDAWSSVKEESFKEWKHQIHARFGPEPFNASMYAKLGMKFWVDLVREAAMPSAPQKNINVQKHSTDTQGSRRRMSQLAGEPTCLASNTGDRKAEWECANP